MLLQTVFITECKAECFLEYLSFSSADISNDIRTT